ncbi:hypothetical protein MBRA_06260 [Methylobacterium brachiatum]|nr:hypothetical protein MBRA_06260 [Methylobacterium brachiatum]
MPQEYRTPALTALYSPEQSEDTLDTMRRRAIAALALINSPRISERAPADLTKLNRARTKRGKKKLLTYSTVVIRPGLHTLRSAGGAVGPEHVGRALHKVRAHFRLRRGRVEIVRSHWRGNEANGVRLHNYRVEA